MKEYEDLRKEVSDRLKELWTLEKFALGGAAAIAAWLLTHVKEVGTNSIAWWIPFIFLALCVCRFGTGMYHLGFRASIYIMKVERRFLGKEGGWETRFRQQGPNETYAYFAVWIAALAAASYLPFATLPVPVAVP
ncbi:MAG: hypothetical protein ABI411_17730 [Tahibacter sp.]